MLATEKRKSFFAFQKSNETHVTDESVIAHRANDCSNVKIPPQV